LTVDFFTTSLHDSHTNDGMQRGRGRGQLWQPMSLAAAKTHSIDISSSSSSSSATAHHVFYYNAEAPAVRAVALLGSFNDWNRDGALQMIVRCWFVDAF
jgi:hypothetical protein